MTEQTVLIAFATASLGDTLYIYLITDLLAENPV